MWKIAKHISGYRVPHRLANELWPPFQGGRWYGATNEMATTTLAMVTDRLYAIPLLITKDVYCNALGMRVTTAAASTHIRIGIYADSGGVPGGLIDDTGVVDSSIADEYAIALTNRLVAGWYWLAALSDGTPTVRAVDYALNLHLMGNAANTDTDNPIGVYAAQSYGALPNSFPAVTYNAADMPRVVLSAMARDGQYTNGWRLTEQVSRATNPFMLPHVTGRYYHTPLSAEYVSTYVLALTANKLYAMPFFVGATHTYTAITIHVTTAAAGKSIQLGIYQDNNGLPDALVLDAGNVSAATTGGKEPAAFSQSLSPGWYWLAAVSDGTPTVRDFDGRELFGWLGVTSGTDTTFYSGMSVSQTYGALPDPFPGGSALDLVPRIMLKA